MIDHIKPLLLDPGALGAQNLLPVLETALSTGAEYADLFLQHSIAEFWLLEDGEVKLAGYDVAQGGAVHAVKGEQSGFAYTEQLLLPSIQHAAEMARCIVQTPAQTQPLCVQDRSRQNTYPQTLQAIDAKDLDKISLLQSIDQAARALDPRVIQVQANLSIDYEAIYFLNSIGECATDERPLIRLDVSVVMLEGSIREKGHAGQGGRLNLQDFLDTAPGEALAKEAVRLARLGLSAKPSPAGVMPVVLGPGWPGVLLHEAVGHGLEGDFNRRGSSAFTGMIGQRVATEHCTVVDDATLANRRGSLAVDDEGVSGQETVLIEAGILKRYMMDRMNARLMGVESTGNGRRESYAHPPIPRMTNTFMRAGQEDPQDIIQSVDQGVYCANFSGGQVDITSGQFVFSANEAYLIESGKLTQPIKNMTLIGDGAQVLKKVSMVGHDLALDTGIGVCGKAGQSVPVGVGQPTLKVDAMVVGGTEVSD